MNRPLLITTLATREAEADLQLFLYSLGTVEAAAAPTIYLYCDAYIHGRVRQYGYRGRIVAKDALSSYKNLDRRRMEATPGKIFPSQWFDFMAEKMNLLDWAFESEPELADRAGVLFCDADIYFLAPLPAVPADALVALSRHEIRAADEAKYGRYNGGFLWMADQSLVAAWRDACLRGARYFEQSALEDVAAAATEAKPDGGLYLFPRTTNYGWWRLFQGEKSVADLQREWTMNRAKDQKAAGILIQGTPLQSIHTHFFGRLDPVTAEFNRWVILWLQKLAPLHPIAAALVAPFGTPPSQN